MIYFLGGNISARVFESCLIARQKRKTFDSQYKTLKYNFRFSVIEYHYL
jgi:hypothetical protein